MSLVTDGQDENGLQVEKVGPTLEVLPLCLTKIVENLLRFAIRLKIRLIFSSGCSRRIFRVCEAT